MILATVCRVAPVQTLTDKEFQMMRDAAFAGGLAGVADGVWTAA